MELAPIANEQEYAAALAAIERLLDAEPGTPGVSELAALSVLIEQYEEIHYPID